MNSCSNKLFGAGRHVLQPSRHRSRMVFLSELKKTYVDCYTCIHAPRLIRRAHKGEECAVHSRIEPPVRLRVPSVEGSLPLK